MCHHGVHRRLAPERGRVAEAAVVERRELEPMADNRSLGHALKVQTGDERDLRDVSQNENKKSNLKQGDVFCKFLPLG
jgi:hypothetical protein